MSSFFNHSISLDSTADWRLHTVKERSRLCAYFRSNVLQWLFLALNFKFIYTKKGNSTLVFSTDLKPGIKKYIIVWFLFSALTSRTDTAFVNIFKNIFRQLLNSKILSQNIFNNSSSIWIHKKYKIGFVKIYVALSSISKLLSLMGSIKSYRLDRSVISCSK